MNWRGEFSVVSKDLLSCEVWNYWIRDDATFELDRYAFLTRATKRHKFVAQKTYNRIGINRRFNHIEIPRPEAPQFVLDGIKQKFIEQIKFI